MLLAGVRKHNYVPKVAEKDYASALRMGIHTLLQAQAAR